MLPVICVSDPWMQELATFVESWDIREGTVQLARLSPLKRGTMCSAHLSTSLRWPAAVDRAVRSLQF